MTVAWALAKSVGVFLPFWSAAYPRNVRGMMPQGLAFRGLVPSAQHFATQAPRIRHTAFGDQIPGIGGLPTADESPACPCTLALLGRFNCLCAEMPDAVPAVRSLY
jgi:hypothetical protein